MPAFKFPKLPRYVVPVSFFGTLVGTSILLKDKIRGKKYENDVRLAGRTVVITGANTGIGKETARDMAKRGAKVIMACRNLKKAEKAKEEIVEESFNTNVHVKHLDLASMKSIREFAKSINTEEKRVDILVDNAGVMRCPKMLTEDGFEMQLGVNHLGHFLLTNLLTDKLKSSAPSRVVILSSIAHVGGQINFADLNSVQYYSSAEAYQQSKLANILFGRELAKRLKDTGVTVYIVHPGVVKTEIGRHLGLFKSFISSTFFAPISWLMMKKPEEGAQTVIYCALEPSIAEESGQYYKDQHVSEIADQAQDDETARRLWAISEKWTGLS